MSEQFKKKTATCLRILKESIDKRGGFRDNHHIFGVMIEKDDKFPERNGLIVYGPNNSENCQAFILGMKEVMIRDENESLEVTWINIRRMLKRLEYYDLFS